MPRRALLTAVFLASLWGALAQLTAAPAHGAPAVAGVDACAHAHERPGTGNPDGEWNASPHADALLTHSAWKSRSAHAALTVSRCVGTPVAAAAPRDSARHSTRAPAHLLHVPLLI